MNSVASIPRDLNAIKSNYVDLKSRTKKKALAELRRKGKTGGGDSQDDDPMDEIEKLLDSLRAFEILIVKNYGKEWLFGVEGGFDSSETQNNVNILVSFPHKIYIILGISNANFVY